MPPPPKITAAIGFLTFASIVLTIVAYLNNWRISLIVVSPSSVPGTLQSPAIEGPTVILNVFGMKIHIVISYIINSINS